MKLKDNYLAYDSGEGYYLIPVAGRSSQMFRANSAASLIIGRLQKETTREEILAAILDTYEVEEERAAADLDRILRELRDAGALEE